MDSTTNNLENKLTKVEMKEIEQKAVNGNIQEQKNDENESKSAVTIDVDSPQNTAVETKSDSKTVDDQVNESQTANKEVVSEKDFDILDKVEVVKSNEPVKNETTPVQVLSSQLNNNRLFTSVRARRLAKMQMKIPLKQPTPPPSPPPEVIATTLPLEIPVKFDPLFNEISVPQVIVDDFGSTQANSVAVDSSDQALQSNLLEDAFPGNLKFQQDESFIFNESKKKGSNKNSTFKTIKSNSNKASPSKANSNYQKLKWNKSNTATGSNIQQSFTSTFQNNPIKYPVLPDDLSAEVLNTSQEFPRFLKFESYLLDSTNPVNINQYLEFNQVLDLIKFLDGRSGLGPFTSELLELSIQAPFGYFHSYYYLVLSRLLYVIFNTKEIGIVPLDQLNNITKSYLNRSPVFMELNYNMDTFNIFNISPVQRIQVLNAVVELILNHRSFNNYVSSLQEKRGKLIEEHTYYVENCISLTQRIFEMRTQLTSLQHTRITMVQNAAINNSINSNMQFNNHFIQPNISNVGYVDNQINGLVHQISGLTQQHQHMEQKLTSIKLRLAEPVYSQSRSQPSNFIYSFSNTTSIYKLGYDRYGHVYWFLTSAGCILIENIAPTAESNTNFPKNEKYLYIDSTALLTRLKKWLNPNGEREKSLLAVLNANTSFFNECFPSFALWIADRKELSDLIVNDPTTDTALQMVELINAKLDLLKLPRVDDPNLLKYLGQFSITETDDLSKLNTIAAIDTKLLEATKPYMKRLKIMMVDTFAKLVPNFSITQLENYDTSVDLMSDYLEGLKLANSVFQVAQQVLLAIKNIDYDPFRVSIGAFDLHRYSSILSNWIKTSSFEKQLVTAINEPELNHISDVVAFTTWLHPVVGYLNGLLGDYLESQSDTTQALGYRFTRRCEHHVDSNVDCHYHYKPFTKSTTIQVVIPKSKYKYVTELTKPESESESEELESISSGLHSDNEAHKSNNTKVREKVDQNERKLAPIFKLALKAKKPTEPKLNFKVEDRPVNQQKLRLTKLVSSVTPQLKSRLRRSNRVKELIEEKEEEEFPTTRRSTRIKTPVKYKFDTVIEDDSPPSIENPTSTQRKSNRNKKGKNKKDMDSEYDDDIAPDDDKNWAINQEDNEDDEENNESTKGKKEIGPKLRTRKAKRSRVRISDSEEDNDDDYSFKVEEQAFSSENEVEKKTKNTKDVTPEDPAEFFSSSPVNFD